MLFKIRKENLIVQRQPLIASIITLLDKEMASFSNHLIFERTSREPLRGHTAS